MAGPALSVRIRRTWRLFRTQQPRRVQALAATVAVLLVADLIGLGAASSSTSKKGQTVAAGRGASGTSAGGTSGSIGPGGSTTGAGGKASAGRTGAAGSGTGATGTGAGVGPGGSGAVGSGGGTSGGGGHGPTVALQNLGHGVTASTIKVVFPWPNLGALGQAVGLYGSSEDDTLSINAAVNAINDAGGINGRKIEPEIVPFNPLDDAAMRADCIKWTQDQQVFAVVDASAWHDDHQLCVTQENHTPLISSWTTVTDWTNRGNPNLWWTGPDDVTVLNNLVAWAVGQHALAPSVKFGVVAADRESDTLAARYLGTDLKNAGLKAADNGSMHFDLQNAATAQAQARDIVTRFNLEHITTVLPLLPYTDFVYFVQAAKEQGYVPHWLISDYESEAQAVIGLIDPSVGGPYASELNNVINPTFLDLGNCDCNKPLPQGYDAFGNQCWQNFVKYSGAAWAKQEQQAGNPWKGNIETTGTAMIWCTDIDLFAAAARAVPPNQLTQGAFDSAMQTLGHFAGQIAPDYSYGPSRRSGPHEFRVVQEHVNSDNKCPLHADGSTQGDCWLILKDWQESLKT